MEAPPENVRPVRRSESGSPPDRCAHAYSPMVAAKRRREWPMGGHHALTDQKPASPGTSMAASLNRDIVIPPFHPAFPPCLFPRSFSALRSVARLSRGHLLFLAGARRHASPSAHRERSEPQ